MRTLYYTRALDACEYSYLIHVFGKEAMDVMSNVNMGTDIATLDKIEAELGSSAFIWFKRGWDAQNLSH
jgi:hypothetical protein